VRPLVHLKGRVVSIHGDDDIERIVSQIRLCSVLRPHKAVSDLASEPDAPRILFSPRFAPRQEVLPSSE